MQNYSLNIQKKFIIKFLTRLLKGSSFQLKAISNDKDSFYWPRLDTKKMHGLIGTGMPEIL